MVEIKLNIGGLSAMPARRSIIPPGGSIPRSVRAGRQGFVTHSEYQRPSRGGGRSDYVAEQVLEQGRTKESEIIEMLNVLQGAGLAEGVMPEFDRLNEQLGQVQEVIANALKRLGL